MIHLASRMLRLLGLWSCGDRASDLHQIPRLAHPAQWTRAEPASLRVDVAQFDLGITHQPVTALGLEDADRFTDQRLTDKDQLARPFDLAVAAHAAHGKVSRAAESHRRALAEPDVRLSPHPAPIVQPRPCRRPQWANRPGCRRAMRSSHCRERRWCRRKDLNFRCAHRARIRSMCRRVG